MLNKFKNQIAVYEKILRIDVLDRNDNPPEIQTDEDINIKLDDPHFRQVIFRFSFQFGYVRVDNEVNIRPEYDFKIAWANKWKRKRKHDTNTPYTINLY